MSLDHFYSGKIDSKLAYSFCDEELAEVDEIFKNADLPLNSLASVFSQQKNLESSWKSIMKTINIESKIPDRIARKVEIIDFVESFIKKKVKVFPVNILRFSIPKYERSRVAWHQDSQTWPGIDKTYPRLQQTQVVTFWACLTGTDFKNGLSFAMDAPSVKLEHNFAEGQGYFSANLESNIINSIETVFGDPYTGVIFGQDRLHRSAAGSSNPRVSIDLRFYSEDR